MENKDVKSENASPVEADNEHNAILLSSVTTERPGNFLFKIESFSLLREAFTKSNRDKCDSCHFKDGGYTWKLSVYPNGDKKRGGDGYISLNLALAYPTYLRQGWEVHVFFKFFVFDHLRDTYLVLQDGKDRRFHALKTEWGIAKLLPLEIFNDPSQGYLVDDRCAFGVEMFFHKKEIKLGSTLSVKNSLGPYQDTFTWKIDKFSSLPKLLKSEVFSAGGRKWFLQLYPKGYSRPKGKSLSLYLAMKDRSYLPCGWNIYADYKMSILDQQNEKHHERTVIYHSFSRKYYGYADFMKLSDLKSESRGFIVKDTVVIELKFMGIYSVNGSLP